MKHSLQIRLLLFAVAPAYCAALATTASLAVLTTGSCVAETRDTTDAGLIHDSFINTSLPGSFATINTYEAGDAA